MPFAFNTGNAVMEYRFITSCADATSLRYTDFGLRFIRWLISSLSDARFLVMIEREKCGPDMKAALADSGIFYCYLDDFYSGNAEDIKLNALFQEMYRWIDDSIKLNVNEMLDAALRNTRLEMSAAERKQFYEKHIRNMSLVIDDDGNVSIELKRK